MAPQHPLNVLSGGPYTATSIGLLNNGPLIAVNAGLSHARFTCVHVNAWCCLDLPEQCPEALALAHAMGVAEIWTSPRGAYMLGLPDAVGSAARDARGTLIRVIEPSGGSLIAAVRYGLARYLPTVVNLSGLDWPPMERFRVEQQALRDLIALTPGVACWRHQPNKAPESIA